MKIEVLDQLCRPWPGVSSDVKWGQHRVYSVGGKMFVITERDGPVAATDCGRLRFKVADDVFLAMTDQPGITPAPHLARAHWVSVADPDRHPREWIEAQVRCSYELVRDRLPKKQRGPLGA